jgi:hypothetical protein
MKLRGQQRLCPVGLRHHYFTLREDAVGFLL